MNSKIQLPLGVTVEAALASPSSDRPDQCLVFEQLLEQYYLADAPAIVLKVVVLLEQSRPVLASIFTAATSLIEPIPDIFKDRLALQSWAKKNAVPCFALDQPLNLSPIKIPKPWGQEIWYTGIEARGQSRVMDSTGVSVPLPWLLAIFPHQLAGAYARDIILLKILAPLAEPVYGDLYFEMHEKKQEVYVVTHVDQQAWPSAVGGIRFGFCQESRAQYESDDAFRKAYLAAVKSYEKIRREIDVIFDGFRQDENIPSNEPVSAEKTKCWAKSLPVNLSELELQLRLQLDSFSAVKPLAVGDVVTVPCFTPHSLMHGVTTVEFQTPVYERKILSFAQKVLTQPHWDTESALAYVSLDAPKQTSLPILYEDAKVSREQVVRFDDFVVERICLAEGQSMTLPETGEYALLMAVDGTVEIQGCQKLAVMEAAFLPADRRSVSVANNNRKGVVFLFSYPVQAVH